MKQNPRDFLKKIKAAFSNSADFEKKNKNLLFKFPDFVLKGQIHFVHEFYFFFSKIKIDFQKIALTFLLERVGLSDFTGWLGKIFPIDFGTVCSPTSRLSTITN